MSTNSDPKLTPKAARLMGELCEELRPGWNRVATANELAKLRQQDGLTVLVATLLAVADPDIATPAGIGFTARPHWQKAQQAVTPETLADDRARQRHRQLRQQAARERANRATPSQIRRIREGAHA